MKTRSKDSRYKRKIIISFLWLSCLILSGYIGYNNSIKNIGFSPRQPVAFSHKKHSGDFGMKCLFCHSSAEKSAFSSIPTTKSCMVCHLALKNQSELMKLVNYSFDNNIPIQYTRVNILPDYTHFNHSRHLIAQIDCSSCHGEVEKMDSIRQEKALTMSWCLDCHRNPEKFIVFARDISGIVTIKNTTKVNMLFPKDFVFPSFGMWSNDLPKTYMKEFLMPKNPSRGPENCSACHY